MQKVLIALGIVLVLLVGAVFAVPAFIDWNKYREQVASLVEEATGRDLKIGGDLSMSLLPLPTLDVEDVTLSSIPGAVEKDFIRVSEVNIRVSLADLLQRRLNVESIRIVEPVVVLERLPEGQLSWDFGSAPKAANGNGGVRASGKLPGGQPNGAEENRSNLALRLDSITVVDGAVLYIDQRTGTQETISDIDMELSAQTLQGPYRASGTMSARGAPLALTAAMGKVSETRPSSISFNLTLPGQNAGLDFSGAIVPFGRDRSLNGEIKGRADSLAQVMQTLDGPLPRGMALPFAMEGNLKFSEATASLDDVSMRLGTTEAKGSLNIVHDVQPSQAKLKLAFGSVDLDTWLKAAALEPFMRRTDAAGILVTPAQAQEGQTATDAGLSRFSLPENVTGTFDVTADAVTWRGGIMRQAEARGTLSGGQLAVQTLKVQLPGGSAVTATGTVATPDGQPQANLGVTAASDNLRGVLTWLGLNVDDVPSSRLYRLRAEGQVMLSPEQVVVREMDATVDTTSLRGAATVALGDRIGVGATLAIGSINMDAYLPRDTGRPQSSVPPVGGQPALQQPADPPRDAGTAAQPNPPPWLEGLGWMNDFDANVRAEVQTLTLNDVPMYDLHVDVSLVGGRLTVNQTGVSQVLDGTILLGGSLSGFGGTPMFRGLTVVVEAPRPEAMARFLGFTLPLNDRQLGAVGAQVTLDGTLKDLRLDADATAAGGSFGAEGTITDVTGAAGYDLAIAATHSDTQALFRRLGLKYEARGPLGPLDPSGRAAGGGGQTGLTGLSLKIGETTLAGDAAFNLLAEPRPQVTATLTGSQITVDRFLPVKQTAALPRRKADVVPEAVLVPAAWSPEPVLAQFAQNEGQSNERWSSEPFDLSVLTALDAEISLRSDIISYDGVMLNNVVLATTLDDAILNVSQLSGGLYGGVFSGNGLLDATTSAPSLRMQMRTENTQLEPLLEALTDSGAATGVLTLTSDLTTTGASPRAMIDSLAGTGSFTVADIAAQTNAGGVVAAIAGPLVALNQFVTLGAGDQDGNAVLAGQYVVTNGIVDLQSVTLDSNLYDASFEGIVNLPQWTVDVQGQAALAQNLLTGLLGDKLKLLQTVPIAVTGSLEAPRVRVETGKAPPEAVAPQAPPDPATAEPVSEPAVPEPAVAPDPDVTAGTAAPSGAPEDVVPPPETAPAGPQEPADVLKGLLDEFMKEDGQTGDANEPQGRKPPKPNPEDLLKSLLKTFPQQ